MTESLMSDARHNDLIKGAEEVIGLTNIGVDGHAALRKVAEDKDMNDHEIELVAQVVNNSKQLAHLQNSEPEDREKPFPLIDSSKVQECQPATNADVNTGDRYGSQEEPSESTKDADQPDSLDINKELSKAASSSYLDDGDYRLGAEPVDNAATLREAWGLQQAKVAEAQLDDHEDENPFAKISEYRIGIEEASFMAAHAKLGCAQIMDKLAVAFRRTDAPDFATFEKAASVSGVSGDFLDLVWDHADLEKFGEHRADLTKTASGRVYVTQQVKDLVDHCVRADNLWKEASDALAAKTVLEDRFQRAEEELLKVAQTIDLGQIGQSVGETAKDVVPTPEVVQQALGQPAAPGSIGGQVDERSLVPQDVRQDIRNISSRATVEDLMQDDFIGSHSLPEVVDAYNAAMSVNPRFGKAELVSYMRQHLATQGSVPLDLQIRARPKKEEGEGAS